MVTAAEWIELLETVDFIDSPEPYSGRGMLGKRCASVTTSDLFATIASIAHAIADSVNEDERDGFWAMLARTRTDSVGMGTVLYWPRATWPQEAAEEAAQS